MAKVRVGGISSSERNRITEEFVEFIMRMRDKDEVTDALIGLMTTSEVLMFARRIQIAKEILKGGTLDDIRRKLKVGFDTMQNVDMWLHTGNLKRDTWLKKEIIKLQGQKLLARPLLVKTRLDRYPEHHIIKQVFHALFP